VGLVSNSRDQHRCRRQQRERCLRNSGAVEHATPLSKTEQASSATFAQTQGGGFAIRAHKALVLHIESSRSGRAQTPPTRHAMLRFAVRARNKRSCKSYTLALHRSETHASEPRNLREAKRLDAKLPALVWLWSGLDHCVFRRFRIRAAARPLSQNGICNSPMGGVRGRLHTPTARHRTCTGAGQCRPSCSRGSGCRLPVCRLSPRAAFVCLGAFTE
jgi:hypothetical protein